MTSENIENKLATGLRYFLAVVFLSAGVGRLIFPELIRLEASELNLPSFFPYLIIAFEILAGACLLLGKNTRLAYFSLTIFLSLALIWALVLKGSVMLTQIGELFIFNLNPTDWFLHLIFLGIVIILLKLERNR
ncbi:MAG: DoxX family membrane protein [Patescibacteria group bacterium]|jgi:uncharacterized membrane protein YphA (DoxX/SURF4 family)